MSYLQPISQTGLKYNRIIGTGGIGSGMFFSLKGDHSLGRNESRLGKLQTYRDFCKQHIIMHYVSVFMGAGAESPFQSFPIGKVGSDEVGEQLIEQMKRAGMDINHIKTIDNQRTLLSVCFQYPDGSGGNITTENSASNEVTDEDIDAFYQNYSAVESKAIVLAVPEVPVSTRLKLLHYGRGNNSLNVASMLSLEVEEFRQKEGFQLVDILAINIDEARHIAGLNKNIDSGATVEACIDTLIKCSPDITVLITDGSQGSYCFQGNQLEFTPSLSTEVVSTAGAGDAFLAGNLCGICCGLPLQKGFDNQYINESPLQTATDLGTLLASFSVTSADTIHLGADAISLNKYAKEKNLLYDSAFRKIFSNSVN